MVALPGGIAIYDRIRAGIERRVIERGDVRMLLRLDVRRALVEFGSGVGDGLIVGPISEYAARPDDRRPVLSVARGNDPVHFPGVLHDNAAVGRLAARHLHKAGAELLAGVDWVPKPFAEERLAAFEAEAKDLGVPCRIVWLHPRRSATTTDPLHWQRELEKAIRPFILRLPERSALFATTDDRAVDLWSVAKACGRRIPEDLLMLGVDDIESGGLLPLQGLSSVALDCASLGRRALDRILEAIEQKKPLEGDEWIPPLGVVARRSTQPFPHDDSLVERALHRIRSGDHLEDTGGTLAVALGVSRVTLWRHFETTMRRTPAGLIREARLEMGRRLLRESRLTVEEIARRCGFYHASSFARAFRRVEGLSPEEWRRNRS